LAAPARWRHALDEDFSEWKLHETAKLKYEMKCHGWNTLERKDEQARLKTSRAERCVKTALVKLQPIDFPRFWIRNRQSKALWPCLIKRGMGLLDIVPINVW